MNNTLFAQQHYQFLDTTRMIIIPQTEANPKAVLENSILSDGLKKILGEPKDSLVKFKELVFKEIFWTGFISDEILKYFNEEDELEKEEIFWVIYNIEKSKSPATCVITEYQDLQIYITYLFSERKWYCDCGKGQIYGPGLGAVLSRR